MEEETDFNAIFRNKPWELETQESIDELERSLGQELGYGTDHWRDTRSK